MVAALLIPVGALANGAGDVTGTVTDGSDPLEGICVSAWDAGRSFRGGDSTDAFGAYAITGIASGIDVFIQFEDCLNGVLATEWWDDADSWMTSDAVTVPDAAAAIDIDAVMAPGGSISGTVVDGMSTPDPGDDTPIEGICVTAGFQNGETGGETVTDALGTYTIAPLRTGSYRVFFEDCSNDIFQPEWWDDQHLEPNANPVIVTAPAATPGIDATLDDGGSISGLVTLAGSDPTEPIDGVCVTLTTTDFAFFERIDTEADGTFSFTGLVDDDYLVSFADCFPRPNYVPEWFDGASGSGTATAIAVVDNADVIDIDADLVLGATISGTVTDPEGAGLSVCVQFSDEFAIGMGTVVSGTDGTYFAQGLTPGSIKVKFTDCLGGPYVDQWWDGKFDFTSGDFINLGSGDIQENVDAMMLAGGSIDGVVFDELTGQPLQSVTVRVVDDDNTFIDLYTTGPDGLFSIGGLVTGDYKMWFQAAGVPYLDEWYQDETSFATGDWIPVTPGGTTMVEAFLEPWGTISGTVTDTLANPIGACITVETLTGTEVGTAETLGDGSYSIEGLTADTYRVRFGDCGVGTYATEYYDDAGSDPAAATGVVVASGQETSGIDAALEVSGGIAGTVIDTAANPLEDICVTAWIGATEVASTMTDASGSYLIAGLAPVDHTVQFEDCSNSSYIGEWHLDAADQASATPVPVSSSGSETVDAELDRGGRVFGLIKSDSGQALADIEVALHALGGESPIATTLTAANGFYSLDGIVPGDYEAHFSDTSNPVSYL
ncbi:MAG: hypothetical protein HKN01_06515, partial [Acidimicrobiia bacterium]|nr:hypothetical protein [Acidimicrobiia bacterium]